MTTSDRLLASKSLKRAIIMTLLFTLPSLSILYFQHEIDVDIFVLATILFIPCGFGIWRIKSIRNDLQKNQLLITQGTITGVIFSSSGSKIIVDGQSFLPLPVERRKNSHPLVAGTYVSIEELPSSGIILRISYVS